MEPSPLPESTRCAVHQGGAPTHQVHSRDRGPTPSSVRNGRSDSPRPCFGQRFPHEGFEGLSGMFLETGHARGIIEINGLHHIPVPQEGGLAFRWAAGCRRVTTGILFNQVENDAGVLVELFPQLRIPLGTTSPFQRLPHRDVPQAIEGTGDASGFLLWRIRRHFQPSPRQKGPTNNPFPKLGTKPNATPARTEPRRQSNWHHCLKTRFLKMSGNGFG